MPVGPTGGTGGFPKGFGGTGGISGNGGGFKLSSIKDKFKAINQQFENLKAGGQHDPKKIKKMIGSVENLEKHPNIDEETKKALDAMKTEMDAMLKEAEKKSAE